VEVTVEGPETNILGSLGDIVSAVAPGEALLSRPDGRGAVKLLAPTRIEQWSQHAYVPATLLETAGRSPGARSKRLRRCQSRILDDARGADFPDASIDVMIPGGIQLKQTRLYTVTAQVFR
jgi:hypothetical protein